MAELGAALTACLPPASGAWTLRDADCHRIVLKGPSRRKEVTLPDLSPPISTPSP